MKREWQKPELEVLDINSMTLAGPGVRTPDAVQPDPTEIVHFS